MRLVTFGIDEDDRLVVCFPIFVKDFSRKSMTLYQIETVPVPILDTNEEANIYSQAVINKPYIATNNDYYIQLEIEELFMCKQIKHIYFCEELFWLSIKQNIVVKVLFSIIWKVHLSNKIVNLNISITQQ